MSKQQLLVDLFEAYYDARRHKRNRSSSLRFELDFERELVELCEEIYSRKYKVGPSSCFIVTKPVKREIFAADFRDRVVHHLIFRYIAPMFERTFIDDSYSCRKGRGTLYGIRRMHHHLKSCTENFTKDAYILKLDIQGYFMNINRRILYEKVMRTIDKMASHRVCTRARAKENRGMINTPNTWGEKLDYSVIKYLLHEIIFNDPTVGCIMKGAVADWADLPSNKSLFGTPIECGLPIGNLTSQLFSNIFLSDFDRYCKVELKLKHYGRYVDDFMVIHSDCARLRSLVSHLRDHLSRKFSLTLHPNKIFLQHYAKGVSFLGVVICGAVIRPAIRIYRSVFEVLHSANRAARGWITLECENIPRFAMEFVPKINSYLGLLRHYAAAMLRSKLNAQISPYLRQWIASYCGVSVVKFEPQSQGQRLALGALCKVRLMAGVDAVFC